MPRLVATSTSSTSPSSSHATTEADVTITLTQPRPDVERTRNEYIDTPLKGGLHPLHAETHPHIHIGGSPHDHLALVSPLGHAPSSVKTSATAAAWASSKSLPFAATSPSLKRMQSTRRSLPITKQPNALSFTKGNDSAAAAATSLRYSAGQRNDSAALANCNGSKSQQYSDSIICPECERCRCLACRTPRPLPSSWMCDDKCLCSADACVDYASCLCCVKALFYHCACDGDSDVTDGVDGEVRCADRPCSCSAPRRLGRWGCVASLTLLLPCLVCYWPLKGGVRCVEMCYQRCTSHGCRCQDYHQQQHHHPTSVSAPPTSASSSNATFVATKTLNDVSVLKTAITVVHTQPISSSITSNSSSTLSSTTSSSSSSSKDLGKRLLDNQ